MSKAKRFLSAPAVTIVMFILAAALLLFSGIGGARAALTYYSETYTSQMQLQNIGVTLLENGEAVANRDYGEAADGTWNENKGTLLEHMLAEGESLKLGKKYTEELCVQNTGTINQFVRVSIYKYWLDPDGKKTQALEPDQIDLNLVNLGSDWLIDEEASKTKERTVLYYNKVLAAGATTPLFADSLIIDGEIAKQVKQETVTGEDGKTTIKTVYAYNGMQFQVEASVDAVQEHNAEDAIWSAWGRRVSVSGNSLSLS